jgi:hypothetical protein
MPDDGNGTVRYRVERLERDLENLNAALHELNGKIDRLILTFVTGSIAISVAIIAATIALLTGQR